MKRIVFTIDSTVRIHKLWKNFLQRPPEGYEYFDINGRPISFGKKAKAFEKSLKGKLFEGLFHLKRNIPFLMFHHKMLSEKRMSKKIDKLNPDLVYCVNGIMYHGKNPWVVDFENPSVFAEYGLGSFRKYKKRIEKILLRDNCRAILSYSEVGKRCFLANFTSRQLKRKVHTVHNALFSPMKIKKIKHEGFNMLFTGTSNLEEDFYSRGGREAVLAFLKLSKKYPDIKLIIRCKVPEREKKLLAGKNAEIHESLLSKEEFEGLFLKSDIYLFPAYIGYALSVLEAMSFGLPIVTSDLLENGEPVENRINGFKVRPPKMHCPFPMMPYYFFIKFPKFELDKSYVERIACKVEYLYNNRRLLGVMSSNNSRKIRDKYSLENKNKLLKKIYRKSIGGR